MLGITIRGAVLSLCGQRFSGRNRVARIMIVVGAITIVVSLIIEYLSFRDSFGSREHTRALAVCCGRPGQCNASQVKRS